MAGSSCGSGYSPFHRPGLRVLCLQESLLGLHRADGSIFSIAIAFLGISAAVFGAWLERAGPRRAMFYTAMCFSTGFLISAAGAQMH
jgi:MFS family permease